MRIELNLKFSMCIVASAFLSVVTAVGEEFSKDELLFFGTGVDTPPSEKSAPPKPVQPEAPSSGATLKSTSGELRVILLEAPKNSFASAVATQLSVQASQSGDKFDPEINFSSGGKDFENALLHGLVAIRSKVRPFPQGLSVRYRCEGEFGSHERDSTALAGAVLLHSLATGNQLYSKVALIGGLGPSAAVTPAIGVGTRLRTLPDDVSLVVGVPMVSEPEVRDLALMGTPEILLRLEVVGLVTLDDAIALASEKQPENLAKASQLFQSIRTACGETPLATFLKNAKVQQRLAEIVQLAPNHFSARLLLQTATNKLPGRMTFLTSQQAILRSCKPFFEALSTGQQDEIRKLSILNGNTLNLMQSRVHPSVERYLIATRAFMRAYNTYLEINPNAQFESMRRKAREGLRKLAEEIKAEKDKLDQARQS